MGCGVCVGNLEVEGECQIWFKFFHSGENLNTVVMGIDLVGWDIFEVWVIVEHIFQD